MKIVSFSTNVFKKVQILCEEKNKSIFFQKKIMSPQGVLRNEQLFARNGLDRDLTILQEVNQI